MGTTLMKQNSAPQDGYLADGAIKRIIWYDPNINNEENLRYFERYFQNVELERFTSYEKAAEFLLNAPGKWIAVTSGTKGFEFVTVVHDLTNLSGIIIFCKNKSYHEEWAKPFRKVQKIVNRITEVQEEIQCLFNKQIVNGALMLGESEATQEINQALGSIIYGSEDFLEPEEASLVYFHSDFSKQMQFRAIAAIFLKECRVQPEHVLSELVNLNPLSVTMISQEFNERSSKDLLEAILYLYSTNILYKEFNKKFAARKYHELAYTLAACMQEIRARPKLSVNSKTILYRGLPNNSSGVKYITNSTMIWPAFTSTSKDPQVAKKFAGNQGIIFEIKLSNKNAHPNAELEPDWTRYQEKEVLLFPHFSFKVKEKEIKDGILWITLKQDGHDNFLSMNEENFICYWKSVINTDIMPKYENYLKLVYNVLAEFDFTKLIWDRDYINDDMKLLSKLKRILTCKEQTESKISIVETWFSNVTQRSSFELQKKFEMKENEFFSSSERHKRDAYTDIYTGFLGGRFMIAIRPVFVKFIDRILYQLDSIGEPFDIEVINKMMSGVMLEMQPGWSLCKEYINTEMSLKIEQMKPEMKQRLTYIMGIKISSKSEPEEVKKLEAKREEVKKKLNTYLETKDSSKIEKIKMRLEKISPSWLEELQLNWKYHANITFEKNSETKIICRFFLSSDDKFKDFITNVGTSLSDHNIALQYFSLHLEMGSGISYKGLKHLVSFISQHTQTLHQVILDIKECFRILVRKKHRQNGMLMVVLEQDGNENLLLMNEKDFSSSLISIIETKIMPTLEEFLKPVYEAITKCDISKFLWSLESDDYLLEKLKAVLTNQEKTESKISLIDQWYRKVMNRFCKAIADDFDKKKKCFIGSINTQKDLYKSLWISCSESIEIFMERIQPLFEIFTDILLSKLDRMAEPFQKEIIQYIVNDIIKEMEPGWCLFKEYIAFHFEMMKPELKSKFEGYLTLPTNIENSLKEAEKLEEKRKEMNEKLNAYLRLKSSPEIEEIKKRIELYYPSWLGQLQVKWKNHFDIKFEKNSESQINCNYQITDHQLKEFMIELATSFSNHNIALQQLISNFVHCKNITNEGLRQLFQTINECGHTLQKLSLDFSECKKISDEGLIALNISQRSQTLQQLSLNFTECQEITDKGLKQIASCLNEHSKSLKFLSLDFTFCKGVTDEGLIELSTTIGQHTDTLQQLTLNFNWCGDKITDTGLSGLATGIKHSQTLQQISLSFSGCEKITDEGLSQLATELSQHRNTLQQLTLGFSFCHDGITDIGLGKLTTVINQHILTLQQVSLDFSECKKITDEGLKQLARSFSPSQMLQQLSLNFNECNGLTDVAYKELARSVSNNQMLQQLSLDFSKCNGLTDVAFKQLATDICLANKTLQKLVLKFRFCSEITDEGIIQLGIDLSKQNFATKEFTFDFLFCSKVSDEGLAKLAQIIGGKKCGRLIKNE